MDFKETKSLFQLIPRINSKQKILIYYVASEENKGFRFIFLAQTDTQFEAYHKEMHF